MIAESGGPQLVAHVGEEARLGAIRCLRVHRAVPQLLAEAFLHLDLILELPVHRAESIRRLDAFRNVEDEDVEAVDGAVRGPGAEGSGCRRCGGRPSRCGQGNSNCAGSPARTFREVLASKLEFRRPR